MWEVKDYSSKLIHLVCKSPDGEEGYPGNLEVHARYELTDANELKIDYSATSDQETPVNLTNHAYWNLEGEGASSEELLGHRLQINAGFYTATD